MKKPRPPVDRPKRQSGPRPVKAGGAPKPPRRSAVASPDERTAGGECAAGPDTVVRLRYAVYDEEGAVVERSRVPTDVVLGYGQLLPGVESALAGARAGSRVTVELGPDRAYGARDPTAILELERGELPPDVEPGDQLEAEHEDGGVVVLTVLEIEPDAVRVDTNHPLAGQKVRFELEIESVRPATDAELDHAADQVERAFRPPAVVDAENAGLIPTRRLLDRPRRR